MGVEDLRLVVEQMLMGDNQIDRDEAMELRNIVLEDRVLSQDERVFLEEALTKGHFSADAVPVIRELLDSSPGS